MTIIPEPEMLGHSRYSTTAEKRDFRGVEMKFTHDDVKWCNQAACFTTAYTSIAKNISSNDACQIASLYTLGWIWSYVATNLEHNQNFIPNSQKISLQTARVIALPTQTRYHEGKIPQDYHRLALLDHPQHSTALKTNMTVENQRFEDASPIKNCDFPLSS